MAISSLLEENADISLYNTFRVPSSACYLVRIRKPADIDKLIQSNLLKENRYVVLGGGSNTLFTKASFNGVVIKNELLGTRLLREDDVHVDFRVASGVNWNDFVEYTINHGFGGLENLILIPGTVGAAPVQNIGAYGVQVSDVLLDVDAVDLMTGEHLTLTNKGCAFGYRESMFSTRKNLFITSVSLRLTKESHHRLNTSYGTVKEYFSTNDVIPTIRTVGNAIATIRQSKLPDPSTIPNCGSFFKNPAISYEKFDLMKEQIPDLISKPAMDESRLLIPAGWLIERCNWKGKRRGNVGVYKNNALVLVHYGEGTGEEILELSENICKDVFEIFGINLVNEVTIVM